MLQFILVCGGVDGPLECARSALECVLSDVWMFGISYTREAVKWLRERFRAVVSEIYSVFYARNNKSWIFVKEE